MTKAEEMQRFDAFVATLPQDSYLRPWLSSIRDEVEKDLRTDIFPTATPGETWERCRKIRKDAADHIRKIRQSHDAEVSRMLSEAKEKADAIVKRADREAEEIRSSLRSDLQQLRRSINAIA